MKDYKEPFEIEKEEDLPNFTPELGARAARDLLVKKGWNQLAYRSDDGKFCLSGAIRYVYAFSLNPEARVFLQNRIQNLLAKRDGMNGLERRSLIAAWNDARGRTKKEVLELLRSVEKGRGRQ